jgi:hypothetical protein
MLTLLRPVSRKKLHFYTHYINFRNIIGTVRHPQAHTALTAYLCSMHEYGANFSTGISHLKKDYDLA